ncbi:MAG: hypothetical protein PHX51_05035 [Clostridia bacterium]|nr:hypothetical protein [Clostridia bacterium]
MPLFSILKTIVILIVITLTTIAFTLFPLLAHISPLEYSCYLSEPENLNSLSSSECERFLLPLEYSCYFSESESNSLSASESTSYVRITSEKAGFYLNPVATSDNLLFYLESGFYAQLKGKSGAFLQISVFDNTDGFYKLYGYCLAEDVKEVTNAQAPYYPQKQLTVIGGNAKLYADKQLAAVSGTLLYGQNVLYIGKVFIESKTFYYVSVANDFGYIDSDCLSALFLEPYPKADDIQPTATDPESQSQPESNDNLVMIVLAISGLPCLIAILKLFSNKRKSADEG